jgi:hypothetical protein
LTTDPIKADCLTDYHAAHHSGTRPLGEITLVVLHSTEGGTAKSVAQYFTSPSSGGSAHLVVDDNHCYRCLTNDQVPWAAPGANTNGFHIEMCGHASWTAAQWKQHLGTLKRAAYKTALHCRLFGIQPVFVNATGLERGREGITTHAEVSAAFPHDSAHHDPGVDWPRISFMQWASMFWKQLGRAT